MDFQSVLIAFGLTLFAGLSTGIGSVLAFFTKRTNTKFLASALGFSAGVMIYISFIDILPSARYSLANELGQTGSNWVSAAAFFGGMAVIGVIDKLVPSFENPHEAHKTEEIRSPELAERFRKLYRIGMLTAVAIAIHNFPEGFATFISSVSDPKVGVAVAVAIAIHNIPEGIAVSIPVFYATGSRKKAFVYSLLSGIAEPVGALAGFAVLLVFFSRIGMGIVFAGVAGIMVFISFDELLPAAREYGENHLSVYGLVIGMGVSASGLLLLN